MEAGAPRWMKDNDVMDVLIRAASEADFALLPEVEADAALAFRACDLDAIAEGEPASVASYLSLPKHAVVFLAESRSTSVLGFAVVTRVDGQAYLKEVAVRHANAGRGIGRRLVDASIAWSRSAGYRHMTLSTFADLPFNAPFYQKLGFLTFVPDPNWPELEAIRENERKAGLEIRPRVAMIKIL